MIVLISGTTTQDATSTVFQHSDEQHLGAYGFQWHVLPTYSDIWVHRFQILWVPPLEVHFVWNLHFADAYLFLSLNLRT